MSADYKALHRCPACGGENPGNYSRCDVCRRKDRISARNRARARCGWQPWAPGSRSFQPMEP